MNVVEMQKIFKQFPGVIACDNVDFTVKKGEIHGLVGENGAGKSTLMNILYGLQKQNSGNILINGEETDINSPKEAIKLGIGMVHQHFMLAPSLTVLQNIIMGVTPTKFGLVDTAKAKEKVRQILCKYSFNLDLDVPVHQLSVGQMQRVEIVKLLYRGAEILILDEPTAVLVPQEVKELFEILKKLKEQGCSVIIITHKLVEVMAITERITVMRKGVVTGYVNTADTNETELADMMVGRQVNLSVAKKPITSTENILCVNNLSVLNDRGQTAVDNVSFMVKAGEILGICGVEGNGQTELVNAITGLTKHTKGKIIIKGQEVQHFNVRSRRNAGMSHIPEDRLKTGCAKNCTIKDNLILDAYYSKKYCKLGILNSKCIDQYAENLIKQFNVKVPNTAYKMGTLSGGNMQKVIVARELGTQPDILIAAQPTRGVDIGAIEYIRQELVKLRDQGKAILLISAELEEIMALSNRIIVMYEGEIVGQFNPEETTESELGLYMSGAKRMVLNEGAL